MKDHFDYIVVGAGSAGCVVAGTLARDPNCRVLVLEAGGPDKSLMIRLAFGFGKMWQKRLFDWQFNAEPDPSLADRALPVIRGRVLGGSASVNALNFVRGVPEDFNRWAQNGAPSWDWASVRPIFEAIESWEKPNVAGRGTSGPQFVRRTRHRDALVECLEQAGEAVGLPLLADYNLCSDPCLSVAQQTLRGGTRWTSADGWLKPVRGAKNVAIKLNVRVTRIVFDGDKAVGVEYVENGTKKTALCDAEVILSAGAIQSPHLLMLSGVGDPETLKRVGIPTRVASSGVGQNLQDHISVAGVWGRNSPGIFNRNLRLDRAAFGLARAFLTGDGPLSDSPAGLVGFASENGSGTRDFQYVFSSTSFFARAWMPPFIPQYRDTFLSRVALLRPKSRGWLSLASDDPFQAPRISSRGLSDDRDFRSLRAGLQDMLAFIRRPEMDPIRGAWAFPVSEPIRDEDLDPFIRSTAINLDHPAGTCRMGQQPDDGAVVDQDLRVHGARSLRVVDGSIFPDLTSGNINAPILMIAQRVAQSIAQRAPIGSISRDTQPDPVVKPFPQRV